MSRYQLAGQAALTALVGILSYFIYKLYNARVVFWRLKKLGLPMPPWNPILGHLPILPSVLAKLPKGAMQAYMFEIISKEFEASDGLYYIDLWPFSMPMMIISDPLIANQICIEYDLGKPEMLKPFFKPIVGGEGMFIMNGERWKRSAVLFAPGFAERVILERTEQIVEETGEYVKRLREYVKSGEMFELDNLTCWYMMDVIGTVTLNDRFMSLTSDNVLATAMRNQLSQHMREEELNPFKRYNPMHPIREHQNSKKMDEYITNQLNKRYQEWKNTDRTSVPQTKSIIDLVIADYMRERTVGDKLDASFINWACAQIRLFLFVGHDSTAATIVYSLYLLSKHPEYLERIRKEHDKLFGTNIDDVPSLLKKQPSMINQLPFTTAVIKETLRLFPPAAAFRGGEAGVFLSDSHGARYPTEGCGLNVLHNVIQRNPKYWPRPNDFVPERWLVGPDHELYPKTKGAWRPFEYGTRNCVGQTLVMLDVKITLVMVVREFDVKDAYAEFDKFNGWENDKKGLKMIDGERAYQFSKGSAHPADGFPCRVYQRN
ncbi:putative N-alkane-inducible cytochrome P450 [Lophiotrema nucula]|uniref:Putative N-alkane-inducible cytochrome P450 n=1 Tax=Lophiotrema nucula TaxID=690887 RepID=A0A6A5YNA9_9PLEO|nr:putative N-alkane-inducible cytochrome P450 [Lophiotrema nucula]